MTCRGMPRRDLVWRSVLSSPPPSLPLRHRRAPRRRAVQYGPCLRFGGADGGKGGPNDANFWFPKQAAIKIIAPAFKVVMQNDLDIAKILRIPTVAPPALSVYANRPPALPAGPSSPSCGGHSSCEDLRCRALHCRTRSPWSSPSTSTSTWLCCNTCSSSQRTFLRQKLSYEFEPEKHEPEKLRHS